MASSNTPPSDKGLGLESNPLDPPLLSTFFQSQLSSQNNQFDLLNQQISNSTNPLNPQVQLNYFPSHLAQPSKNAGSHHTVPGGYFPSQSLQLDYPSTSSMNPFDQQQLLFNSNPKQSAMRSSELQFGENSIMSQVIPSSVNNDILNELQSQINSIKKVNEVQKETLEKLMSSIQLFSNEINNHKKINEMYKAKLCLYNQAYMNNMNQHQPSSSAMNPFKNYQGNQPNVTLYQSQENSQVTPLNLEMRNLQDRQPKQKK